jgi:arsenical pump membrane protein
MGAMVVGFTNNIVNNLPLELIAGGTIQAVHTKGLMANAVLIGVDLGPNLSVTGLLATILWLLALRKDAASDTGGENRKYNALLQRRDVILLPHAL